MKTTRVLAAGLAAGLALVAGLGSTALASHFTGSYQDPQTGTTMIIQQGSDGLMQGTLASSGGQFAFQGQGNEQGAYGAMMTPQGVLGFQAQLGPDGGTLQLMLYRVDANGRPTSAGQQMVLQRTGGGAPSPFPPGGTPTTPGPSGAPFPPGGTQMPPGMPGAP